MLPFLLGIPTCVVVISPNLSVQARLFQRRPDVVLDQASRIVCADIHGRISILAVEWLVLNGDGIDSHATVGKGLDVLDKVIGVCVCVLRVEVVVVGGARSDAIELHPARWAPAGAQQLHRSAGRGKLANPANHVVASIGQAPAG